MSIGQLIQGLEKANGDTIIDLNANWTSKWYPFGEFLNMAVHLKWSDINVQGSLYLDYSTDPDGSFYTVKNNIALDGSFDEMLFLDSNLAVTAYRLRFEHTLGAADLLSFHNYKRGE